MISVEEARNIIFSQVPDWGDTRIPLQDAMNRVLAEEIIADRDFPPFDRVTMDGIGINSADYANGLREFHLEGTQYAGEPVKKINSQGAALEVMTGAMTPENCDMVIRYEDVTIESGIAKIEIDTAVPGQNIHRKGSDAESGSCLVNRGCRINSGIVSILATVGKSEVLVKQLPKVAIISTGDELVDIDQQPAPFQIRKSNVASMQAVLSSLDIDYELFHLLDDKGTMRQTLEKIMMAYDVLILSGGVSKGKADYVPQVLSDLGVKKLFHKVAQRPGKPFWFGITPQEKPVFALPGNPLSTQMCFTVYFLEWLKNRLGLTAEKSQAMLAENFTFKPTLGYFLQVSTYYKDHAIHAKPEMGNGSGDLANLAVSDAFIYLPAERQNFESGECFDLYRFP